MPIAVPSACLNAVNVCIPGGTLSKPAMPLASVAVAVCDGALPWKKKAFELAPLFVRSKATPSALAPKQSCASTTTTPVPSTGGFLDVTDVSSLSPAGEMS